MLKRWLICIVVCSSVTLGCSHIQEEHQQVYGEPKNKPRYDLTGDDEIIEKPGKYMGSYVELKGEVQEIVSENVFRLDLDGLWGRDRILVINATSYEVPLKDGDTVKVMGPVRVFVTRDIEEEVNYDLLDSLYVEYENTPVIIADQIIGFWAENRPTERLNIGLKSKSANPYREALTRLKVAKPAASQETCELKVFFKTSGAVGNPCMTTEEFARQILNPAQMTVFHRLQEAFDSLGH